MKIINLEGYSNDLTRLINYIIDDIFTYFMEVGSNLEYEEIYGSVFPLHLSDDSTEGMKLLKNLHRDIRDNYLHNLSPLKEFVLYNVMAFVYESSDDHFNLDCEINELIIDEKLDEEDLRLLLSLHTPNNVIGIVFEDIDFLDVPKMFELYKRDPNILSEFFHVDLGLYKELMPPDIQADYEYIKNKYFPVNEPSTDSEFKKVINNMVSEFKHDIEHKKGFTLLNVTNDKKLDEKRVQTLFYLLSKRYLSETEIVINPEVDMGRGYVDFYFSYGKFNTALVELKLGGHSKFKNGLKYQLPTYLKSEEIDFGIFMLICYEAEELERSKYLYQKAEELSEKYNKDIKFIQVNSTGNLKPASKINYEDQMGFE